MSPYHIPQHSQPSSEQSGQSRSRRQLPEIRVQRPRCPRCSGIALKKFRSITDQGDGTALAWVKCACGYRFRVLLE